MDIFRLFARGQVQAGDRLALLTILCGLMLPGQASQAAQSATTLSQPPPGPLTGAGLRIGRGGTEAPVGDVIVRADGVLWGRVVDGSFGNRPGKVAGLRVKLLRGRHTVAITATGPQGEFALRNLPGGLYRVVVERSGAPSWRFYRIWTCSAAPPRAQEEINLLIGDPVVRGQYPTPFPITSLRQATTITGIAAGAIAAPVIYHNTLIDNQVPQSP